MGEGDPVVGVNERGDLIQIREAQTPDDLAEAFKALFFCEHTEEQVRAGFNKAANMGRASTLAEVRRVVTEAVDDLRHNAGLSPADMLDWNGKAQGAIWVRDEILARLERL